MKNIEEKLKLKKLDIDNIEIPDDLEGRLRSALSLVEIKTQKPSHKLTWFLRHKTIAAAIILVLVMSVLNYDVFAYYGKKIIGYDKITSGSFKVLNELGKGQEINKSYKFKNGTEVILDGVMFDNNKLTIMYRFIGESQDKIEDLSISSLKGYFKTYQMSNGQGVISDDKKEVRWINDYQPLSVFDRNLTFSILSNSNDISKGEEGSISFKINMDKAIKRTVYSKINKTIESKDIKYKFTTLSASQMSVSINGTIQANSEKDKELFGGPINGVRTELKVELLESYNVNGKVITKTNEVLSSSVGSNLNGVKFQYNFDGLKPNLKSLILNVLSTEDMKFIDKKISIDKSTKDERVVPNTDELFVKKVKVENGNTVVTFIGEKDIVFDTGLFIGDVEAAVLETNSKIIDENGTKMLEKTYKFKGTANNMKLMFKTLSHRTTINKSIVLYEEK